jgi:hypothetical protein
MALENIAAIPSHVDMVAFTESVIQSDIGLELIPRSKYISSPFPQSI